MYGIGHLSPGPLEGRVRCALTSSLSGWVSARRCDSMLVAQRPSGLGGGERPAL